MTAQEITDVVATLVVTLAIASALAFVVGAGLSR